MSFNANCANANYAVLTIQGNSYKAAAGGCYNITGDKIKVVNRLLNTARGRERGQITMTVHINTIYEQFMTAVQAKCLDTTCEIIVFSFIFIIADNAVNY